MASLNKVILIGHMTADPELKQTQTGVAVCSFSIGVSRRYTKAGEQPQSDFFNIVSWRTQAEFVSKYFHKGNAICIVGSLQTRNYTDQQGSKRYVTEVVADEISFVEKKSDSQQPHHFDPANEAVPAFGSEQPTATATTTTPKFEEVAEDDDLPF